MAPVKIPATLLLVLAFCGQPALAQEVSPAAGSSISLDAERNRAGLGDFATDLFESSVDLFSTENLPPLLVVAGSTGAVHAADSPVRDYFDGGDRFGVFEEGLGEQMGRLPVVFGVVGGLWTVSRFHGSEHLARFSHDLAQASALTGLVTLALKQSVGRERPNGANDLSFPSGHTSAAFAVASVVDHYYGRTASLAAYAAAGFVAASRLDAGKHYLSDVVAGAGIGYITARTVMRRGDRSATGFSWTPVLAPGSRTFGVAVSWQLGD